MHHIYLYLKIDIFMQCYFKEVLSIYRICTRLGCAEANTKLASYLLRVRTSSKLSSMSFLEGAASTSITQKCVQILSVHLAELPQNKYTTPAFYVSFLFGLGLTCSQLQCQYSDPSYTYTYMLDVR